MIEQSSPSAAAALTQPNPNRLIVRVALLLAGIPTVMSGSIISAALPAIQTAFEGVENIALLSRLVLTLPALFIAIGSPLAGYILDRYGRKPMLIVTAVLFAVTGVSGYVVESLAVLLIGRALLGLAVAGLMTSVSTLVVDYYTGGARAQFMGIQTAFMGLSGTLFLALGGVLAEISWRTPFLVYLFTVLILPLLVFVIYEPPHVDRGGPQTVDHAAERAPVALIVFVFSVVMILQIVFNLVPVQLPFHLHELTGSTAAQSGMVIAVMPTFFALASSLYGWFDRRFGHITLVMAAFVLTGIGYVAIGQATDWTLIALGLPLGGFGIGLAMPNLSVWLANETPAHLRGRILGGLTTAVFLGQFISPIVSQPVSSAAGLAGMYAVFGLILLVLAVIVVIFRGRLQQLGTH